MIEFTRARDALDAGDLPALAGVLDEHPHAIHHRGEHCSGYFAGATLLHHVAGNPIRCPLPANIVEITRLLLDRGADLADPDILSGPLWNVARATAEALADRGAPMDLRHAAALGRVDVVAGLLDAVDEVLLDEALIYAGVQGELDSVRLVGHGAKGDGIGLRGPGTALHEAANRGFGDIVAYLSRPRRRPTVVDRRFGGTPAQWARHVGTTG